MVRAKFKCTSVIGLEDGGKAYVFFAAVDGEENKTWSQYTPSGQLQITITNPDAQKFEVGREYYLDFTQASPCYITAHASDFVGTPLQEISPGVMGIRAAMVRSDVGTTPRPGAKIAFAYRGPSKDTVPLGDGEIRRQIGLRLRAANTCNVVYVMWWIAPSPGLHVSVKSNPGMNEHSQCGDRGYIDLQPTLSRDVRVIQVGQKRTMAACIEGNALYVDVDGTRVLETALPHEAFAFDGPVGIRTDNGEFDVEFSSLVG